LLFEGESSVLYELTNSAITKLEETTFGSQAITERADLQRLLKQHIEVIAPDTLIISEEFCEWDESKRRIDLLGLDRDANLVVIELKRTEDGGHMELQAIRYAAMVSAMTFSKAVEVYARHLATNGAAEDAQNAILQFLDWEAASEDQFGKDVRIVLVSAEFSKEITNVGSLAQRPRFGYSLRAPPTVLIGFTSPLRCATNHPPPRGRFIYYSAKEESGREQTVPAIRARLLQIRSHYRGHNGRQPYKKGACARSCQSRTV